MDSLSYKSSASCPMTLFSISSLTFLLVEKLDANHDQDGNSSVGGSDEKSWSGSFGSEAGT